MHQRKCREMRDKIYCFDIINDNIECAWTAAVQSSMELLQTQHLVTAVLLIVRLALASNPPWSCMMKPISILAPHPHVHMKYRYLTLLTGFIIQTSVPLTPIYSFLTLTNMFKFNEKLIKIRCTLCSVLGMCITKQNYYHLSLEKIS